MNMKVIASTTGMITSTTTPVRKPSDSRLTAMTMSTASASTLTNSLTARVTARGWSATRSRRMPAGSCASIFSTAASSWRPSATMSPPLRIDTPIPSASCPM